MVIYNCRMIHLTKITIIYLYKDKDDFCTIISSSVLRSVHHSEVCITSDHTGSLSLIECEVRPQVGKIIVGLVYGVSRQIVRLVIK